MLKKSASAVASDDCGNHISRYVGALIFSGVFAKALCNNNMLQEKEKAYS